MFSQIFTDRISHKSHEHSRKLQDSDADPFLLNFILLCKRVLSSSMHTPTEDDLYWYYFFSFEPDATVEAMSRHQNVICLNQQIRQGQKFLVTIRLCVVYYFTFFVKNFFRFFVKKKQNHGSEKENRSSPTCNKWKLATMIFQKANFELTDSIGPTKFPHRSVA